MARTALLLSGLVLALAACDQPQQAAAPATGGAQGAPIEFRVVATDRNPSACQRWDSDLVRVHTFTRTGDTATLRTAGGITRTMTQTSPGVFTTVFAIGGTNFNVVANTAPPPGSLDVSEPRTGCRWSAVAR